MTYDQLEHAIAAWCQSEPAILAAVIVGSRVRIDPPPDAWADLDVVIFTPAPETYAAGQAWLARLGPAWLTYLDHAGAGDPEWFALFDDGCKADFVFLRATPGAGDLSALIAAAPYQDVFRRGVRVLCDAASPHPAAPWLPSARELIAPTASEFDRHLKGTLLMVNKAARLLARADRWRASQLVNAALKSRLLTMLEWEAQATAAGDPPDTWHDGRRLEQWANPAAVAALPATIGAYDLPSLWAALQATLALYCLLARAAAAAWAYQYPDDAEARLRAWLAETVAIALIPHQH
jgi:aminoglycoside 6-adenylyltransferase